MTVIFQLMILTFNLPCRYLKLEKNVTAVGTFKQGSEQFYMAPWSPHAKENGLPNVVLTKHPSHANPPGMCCL